MKRSLTRLALLLFLAPVLFFGCSGDDGGTGATGATGPPGTPGTPGTGVTAEETCVLCHAAGKSNDVNAMHRLDPATGNRIPPGTVAVRINSVVFGAPVGDSVPVTVNFTFTATDQAGTNITPNIDLRTATASGLSYLRFTLAKLVPGANGDSDDWSVFEHRPGQSGSGPYYENSAAGISGNPATGVYSYAFPANSVRVSDGYVTNAVMRMVVEVRGLAYSLFTSDTFYDTSTRRPVTDAIYDSVPPAGGGTGVPPSAAFPVKNSVSTAACNACHDPLAIHGGSRREYKYCQACHNPKLEAAYDNSDLMNIAHKIHNHQIEGAQNLGELGDFSEVTYPQDIRNCTRCHQGPDASNSYDNWKNRPTMTACGSCHYNISFVSPVPAGKTLHTGGTQANNQDCRLCHPADGVGYGKSVTEAHATENSTPNNPQLPGTLATFEYGIDQVTVDASNVATIKFWIKKDGAFLNLGDNTIRRPSGFSGGPAFLFAYAMPQDNVARPLDYNNLGRAAGQPESLSIVGLPIVAYDNVNFSQYTVQRANAFPVGAIMRAVALQSYFTQTSGGPGLDNVGRHTPSASRPVTGDAVRRVAVESGYVNGKPVGCLECHEIFEGHGGQRVSNAQVCVMCHNPNLSTSGRTITGTINPEIVALFGSNPLLYPEVSNNFKEMIHGLHAATVRTTNYVDIRNRQGGVLLMGDEITYPGDPSNCGKCHLNNLYQAIETTGRLLTTAKTTTGKASETAAEIVTARGTLPNVTDEVNSPASSACGHCHDSSGARSHFLVNGGKVRAPRGTAAAMPPVLQK